MDRLARTNDSSGSDDDAPNPKRKKIECAIQMYLSEGTLIHIRKSKDAGKLICNLMTAMFSNDEMEKCLVTGKRIKQEERERELLDQDKVSAIVGELYSFIYTVHY